MPEMEPIPDIKDIIAPPEVIDPNINFFLIIGIIIGSIILLAYIFLYWLKIKTTLSPEELTDQRKKALDQLHKLKLDHTKISAKEVANIIISSIRPVIQSKFGNLSLSLTTDEFLIQFKAYSKNLLGDESSDALIDILNDCDRLRFSPNNENNSERENLIIRTIKLVRKFPKKDENSSTN